MDRAPPPISRRPLLPFSPSIWFFSSFPSIPCFDLVVVEWWKAARSWRAAGRRSGAAARWNGLRSPLLLPSLDPPFLARFDLVVGESWKAARSWGEKGSRFDDFLSFDPLNSSSFSWPHAWDQICLSLVAPDQPLLTRPSRHLLFFV